MSSRQASSPVGSKGAHGGEKSSSSSLPSMKVSVCVAGSIRPPIQTWRVGWDEGMVWDEGDGVG